MAHAVDIPGASVDSATILGLINDQIVFGLIADGGALTRTDITDLTGLSKPTVSAVLRRLMARSIVEEGDKVRRGRGPAPHTYRVNPSAARVVAIRIDNHGSEAVLAGLTGEVTARHAVAIPNRRASRPRDEVRRLVDAVAPDGLVAGRVRRIVVATPGVISPATGTLRHAQQLHGWEQAGLFDRLGRDLGVPVTPGNDVNFAAVAEGMHGAASGCTDFALLWLDAGTGVGLVHDGRPRVGAHGGAGEIGYLPVPGLDALPRTDRGAAGAFQHLVGQQGIAALAARLGLRGGDPVEVVARAREDPGAGREFLAELARRVAMGVAAIAVLDPELIVIGGPVALAGGQGFVDAVDAAFRRIAFVRPRIALSTVGDGAILDGAIDATLRDVRSRLFVDAVPAGRAPVTAGR